MKFRLLTIYSLVLVASLQVFAQKEELKFNVMGGSTQLKMLFRLANVGDKATITLGNGQKATIEQTKAGNEPEVFSLNLTPQSEDYELSIEADKLVTLRIAASKSINGVKSLVSKSLIRLNLDETKLTESPELDFTACPNIEEITLAGSDVTDVKLPKTPQLKSFIASPALFSKKAIKTLDLSACNKLETLGLQGVALRTIDVRACRNSLKQLTIRGVSNKEFPTQLLGGKELKKLTLVNISYCAIGIDELPDLNETQLDNFKISKMYWHFVKPDRTNGLTVDFKNMKNVKGISEAPVPTRFTWFQKINGKWSNALDATIVTEKDGIFTFSPSILDKNGVATVRCKVESAAYPDLAFNSKTGLLSYNVTLSDPSLVAELTITKTPFEKDDDGEDKEDFDMTMQIAGSPNTSVKIDWGIGDIKTYTITSNKAQQVTGTVELGKVVRIYGDITLLDATRTHLTAVTLRNNASKLKVLRLAQNKIATLALNQLSNLEELMITDNQFTSLNLEQLPRLTELYCGYNKFTSLDVSKAPLLTVLNINNNTLAELDVKSLSSLEILVASDNKLTSMNLLSNKKLRSIDLMNNQISELKVETEQLQKLLLSNNQLEAINFAGIQAPKLYTLDLSRNKLNACTINDYLMLLPKSLTSKNSELKHIVKLAGNPGARTYDNTLIPISKGDGGITWTADVEGDGTGCTTAKIFDFSSPDNKNNGSAKLQVTGNEVGFAIPITKQSQVTVTLTPKAGYKIAWLRFSNENITANSTNPNKYTIELQHNSSMEYYFVKSEGTNDIFANAISVMRVAGGYQLGNLPNGACYTLYSVSGAVLNQGITYDGTLTLSLEQGNYLLKINNSTLKLIF